MMAAFVWTAQAAPPAAKTLMVRSGGSICFAAFSLWTGWKMIFGGRETAIDPPQQWWDADAPSLLSSASSEAPKCQLPVGQLTFDLHDCKTQSVA